MYKVLLVDDNPNVLFSIKRALSSGNNQWTILTAESGKIAAEVLGREAIDIILCDLAMPEMNGVELLTLAAKLSPSTLRIALTGATDQALNQQATKVAHQFISKPINPQEMTRIISQIIGVGNLVINPYVKAQIAKIANLPSQPSLYTQLIAELNKPDFDLERVSLVISQDISMTAKILQLVNSAYFGLAREVTEVSQAVFFLGMETIRDLAFSIHLFSQFDHDLIEKAGLENLWDHSLRVATCSRMIVSTMTRDKKQIASGFTAGMLHDIGKLILGTTAPDLYKSLYRLGVTNPVQVLPHEKKEFGATHAEIGAYLLGIWGLPREIIDTVLYHHYAERLNFAAFSTAIAVWYANGFVDAFSNAKKADGFTIPPELQRHNLLREYSETWKNSCLQVLTQ